MPLYEYKCVQCGKRFDALQKFSDEPLKTHEECGGDLERLVSAPAFHFKGTGWYVTDYAKSNGQTPPGDGAKSESKEGAKTETKPDSKTDAKSETKPAASPAPATPAPTSSSSENK